MFIIFVKSLGKRLFFCFDVNIFELNDYWWFCVELQCENISGFCFVCLFVDNVDCFEVVDELYEVIVFCDNVIFILVFFFD